MLFFMLFHYNTYQFSFPHKKRKSLFHNSFYKMFHVKHSAYRLSNKNCKAISLSKLMQCFQKIIEVVHAVILDLNATLFLAVGDMAGAPDAIG